MENKNKPAFYNPNSYSMQGDDGIGLTKLEYFSAKFASGYVSSWGSNIEQHETEIAKRSVSLAKALIKVLESEDINE